MFYFTVYLQYFIISDALSVYILSRPYNVLSDLFSIYIFPIYLSFYISNNIIYIHFITYTYIFYKYTSQNDILFLEFLPGSHVSIFFHVSYIFVTVFFKEYYLYFCSCDITSILE